MIAPDSRMPLLSRALDPKEIERVLHRLASWEGAAVRAIRAVRYKPGRRCLIEYDVAQPSSAPAQWTVYYICALHPYVESERGTIIGNAY